MTDDMDGWPWNLRKPAPPLIGQGHIWPPAQSARISCVTCGLTVYFDTQERLVVPAAVHEPCPGDPEKDPSRP